MSWIGKNRAVSAVDWIEENKPQDGPFIVYYKDDPISVTTDINESKNKQVRWEMHFKDGKRADGNSYGWFWDGTIRFYPNGMVVDQWNYKDGIRDGIWISRNKDGSIRKKTIYDNGKTK